MNELNNITTAISFLNLIEFFTEIKTLMLRISKKTATIKFIKTTKRFKEALF